MVSLISVEVPEIDGERSGGSAVAGGGSRPFSGELSQCMSK